MKNKFYWISSFTWGILGTLIGFFVWLFFLCLGKKSSSYKGCIRTVIGNSTKGGCFSIGIFTFVSDKTDWINNHEFGHCIQNAIYGPLVFFIVSIPSMINYQMIEHSKEQDWSKHEKKWYEEQATKWGSKDW